MALRRKTVQKWRVRPQLNLMRILAVTNCPALERYGSGYVIWNFVNGMRGLGHDVHLLEPDSYEILQSLRPRANSYRQAVGMFIAARRELRVRHYDLVEFWGAQAWLATLWVARRKAGRPLIVQHTNGPEPRYHRMFMNAGCKQSGPFHAWHVDRLMTQAFRRADGIVTASEYDGRWLADRGLPSGGRLKTIENPLPECFLGRSKAPHRARFIGFCGSWIPRKGIAVLVADVTRLLREFADWRFLVLGTDDNANVSACFPDDVRGRVEVVPMIMEKEALARQYERMEIFVMPSLYESFGVTLAEAMACGCPVVTTAVGFGASLIDGREALLLESPASPVLYHAVKRLILDPDLRLRLGVAGWKRAQHLRWNRAVQALSDTYEHWISQKSAGDKPGGLG
jgi:glycosyltransferase involved in cell wall biosynthesis